MVTYLGLRQDLAVLGLHWLSHKFGFPKKNKMRNFPNTLTFLFFGEGEEKLIWQEGV